MKTKIAILGSTGSIGLSTIEIIKKNKNSFELILISTNKNIKLALKQIKLFNVKNLIIHDKKTYQKYQNILFSKKINLFSNVNDFKKKYKKKLDYSMCSIAGLDGLKETIDIIEISKKVAIANKESIISGWDIIKKKIKKYKTIFIPIDSEHFSIWSLFNNKLQSKNIEKIYITASGGPFFKFPLKNFKNISPKIALKHPKWKMGKKITIDSSTLMNKVFEVIEAKKIFNLDYNKIDILIHPNSYVHSIIKYNNGIIKLLIHETSMKIPIFNSLFYETNKTINSKKLDLKKINYLDFSKIDTKRFPSIKLLKLLPKKNSLFETVIVSANDELVNLFLEQKINYTDINRYLVRILKMKQFQKYKRIQAKTLAEIQDLNKVVRFKIRSLSV